MINYGQPNPSEDKSFIFESKTDHDSREAYSGERYSPIIHVGDGDRFVVAPYLPFTNDLVKEVEAFTVIRRHTLVSMDEQGFVVPANGIPRMGDTAEYEGRPLVYADRDHGAPGAAYGDWEMSNVPVNMNPFTAAALLQANVNAQGVVTGAAGDPTDGGIAGRTYVGVSAGRFPVGMVTDKVVSRAGRYQFREFDPQRTLTVLVHRVVLLAERSVHRRNYGQAAADAIAARNALVGSGTALALDNVDNAPDWATNDGNDLILPGDLVACDDRGELVKLDARIQDFAAVDDAFDAYPPQIIHSVVGRCSAREKVVGDQALALVRTYKNTPDVGGSGTNGVEKILTRGNAMTSGEVTAITAALGATKIWDAEEGEKYGLLVHLNLV